MKKAYQDFATNDPARAHYRKFATQVEDSLRNNGNINVGSPVGINVKTVDELKKGK